MFALALGDTLDGIDVTMVWSYGVVSKLLMLVVALQRVGFFTQVSHLVTAQDDVAVSIAAIGFP